MKRACRADHLRSFKTRKAHCSACACLGLTTHECRFIDLRVFEMIADTAAGLLEVARGAAPEMVIFSTVIYSLQSMHQAGHPGMSLRSSCSANCLVYWRG